MTQVFDVFIIANVDWISLSVQRMDAVVVAHPFINFHSLALISFPVKMEPLPVSTADVFIFLVLNKVIDLLSIDVMLVLKNDILELLLVLLEFVELHSEITSDCQLVNDISHRELINDSRCAHPGPEDLVVFNGVDHTHVPPRHSAEQVLVSVSFETPDTLWKFENLVFPFLQGDFVPTVEMPLELSGVDLVAHDFQREDLFLGLEFASDLHVGVGQDV